MSPARLAVFATLVLLSSLWAIPTLFSQYARASHSNLVAAIRKGNAEIRADVIDQAIAQDRQALRFAPCNVALHEDLWMLLAYQTDRSMVTEDIERTDRLLAQTQEVLASQLACAPMNGKAWLDYAMLNTYREGFAPRALKAYQLSAYVAPSESWLAQKRLLFGLKFRPFFDEAALQTADRDIEVLARAHGVRTRMLLQQTELKSPQELKAAFEPEAAD